MLPILPVVIMCTLTAPTKVSALHLPLSQVAEHRIELREPEHGHSEQDTQDYGF